MQTSTLPVPEDADIEPAFQLSIIPSVDQFALSEHRYSDPYHNVCQCGCTRYGCKCPEGLEAVHLPISIEEVPDLSDENLGTDGTTTPTGGPYETEQGPGDHPNLVRYGPWPCDRYLAQSTYEVLDGRDAAVIVEDADDQGFVVLGLANNMENAYVVGVAQQATPPVSTSASMYPNYDLMEESSNPSKASSMISSGILGPMNPTFTINDLVLGVTEALQAQT